VTGFTVPTFKNLAPASRAKLLPGFDPLQRFLRDVSDQLGHRLALFPDPFVDDVVRVLWLPTALPLAPRLALGRPRDPEAHAVLQAALQDLARIQRIGGSLVHHVQLSKPQS
jgi:hypothetical protein